MFPESLPHSRNFYWSKLALPFISVFVVSCAAPKYDSKTQSRLVFLILLLLFAPLQAFLSVAHVKILPYVLVLPAPDSTF